MQTDSRTAGAPPGSLERMVRAQHGDDELRCIDELHLAARDFTRHWLREPQASGFTEWAKACERLERAAVAYADSLRPNEKLSRPAAE